VGTPVPPPPIVGVDVGGTKLLAVRLDADGGLITDPVQASPRSGAELVDEVAGACRRLAGDGPPGFLGLGIPGLVDTGGVARFAPHLPGLVDAPLGEALAEVLPGWSTWIGNDVTAAVWAERVRGIARQAADVVMVTLGTGIGGGIICGGQLIVGSYGYAGEFGHMVVDPHGPRCPCGRRGCWERYASGSGLAALGRELAIAGGAPRLVALAGGDPEAVRGEHVTAAAGEGDGPARDIMTQFGWWVALGLANLARAFDPELIVVGGGLIAAGDTLIGPTRQAFDSLVEHPRLRTGLRIEPAALGVRAGAVGAGLLAASGR
jgi:glucokinase